LNSQGNRREHGARWLDERNNPEIEKVNGKYRVKAGYENHPVRYVTWYGAAAYAKWAGKRLPTEAEWELTASNYGTTSYPWDDRKWHDDYCNWGDGGELDGFELTAPVDTFLMTKNHDDCLNMVGNVSEWVTDWYAPYNPADTLNPLGPSKGSQKVHRGGSYNDDKEWLTTRARRGADPSESSPYIGFRCAADVPKKP
jgi:sulfatase modifying factor 1